MNSLTKITAAAFSAYLISTSAMAKENKPTHRSSPDMPSPVLTTTTQSIHRSSPSMPPPVLTTTTQPCMLLPSPLPNENSLWANAKCIPYKDLENLLKSGSCIEDKGQTLCPYSPY